MSGVINIRFEPLNSGIKIVKTAPYRKKNIITRLCSWLIAFFHLLIVLTFRFRSHEILLISNPPLISFLPYFTTRNYSVLIFDVYPDALTSGGFIKRNSGLFRIWREANFLLYRKAEQVFTISHNMKESIAQYCEASKIQVGPLWSSYPPTLIPRDENHFIRTNQLQNKFIVMYSGNMGRNLGLEIFLDVAQKLSESKEIVFLFIGEGWIKHRMMKLAKEKLLRNCLFMSYQDSSILMHSLSAADISIVALPSASTSISIPNKTYTLIALGRPLLCLADHESELSLLINKNKIGLAFERNEIDEIVEFILKTKTNEAYHRSMIINAQECSREFTKENAKAFLKNSTLDHTFSL